MAKVKGKLVKENKVGPLEYTKRPRGDKWTHNVKFARIKPKNKSRRF